MHYTHARNACNACNVVVVLCVCCVFHSRKVVALFIFFFFFYFFSKAFATHVHAVIRACTPNCYESQCVQKNNLACIWISFLKEVNNFFSLDIDLSFVFLFLCKTLYYDLQIIHAILVQG